jgi:hypothetical protein
MGSHPVKRVFEPYDIIAPIDAALARETDPHRRAILKNHRYHVILEVCGRYAEIFAPDLTIAEPRYLIAGKTGMGGKLGSVFFEGRKAVEDMYHATRESGCAVMCFVDQKIGATDWGLATEGTLHQFCTGAALIADGEQVDDPNAMYLLIRRAAVNWYYTDQPLLIGEHAYEDVASRTLRKCAPEEVVTLEEARAVLEPELSRVIP